MVKKCCVFWFYNFGYVNYVRNACSFSWRCKKFVNRWEPTKIISGLYKTFWVKVYAIKGRRRTLNWKFNPVHTIHSTEAMKRPSVLCFLISPRRKPKKEESFEKDQLQLSQNSDYINDFKDLSEKKTACDFECKINDDTIKLVNENRSAITK